MAKIRTTFYSLSENLILRARSEITGYTEIGPTENPGARIQNPVFAFGSIKIC